jgi:hypothetical protein
MSQIDPQLPTTNDGYREPKIVSISRKLNTWRARTQALDVNYSGVALGSGAAGTDGAATEALAASVAFRAASVATVAA